MKYPMRLGIDTRKSANAAGSLSEINAYEAIFLASYGVWLVAMLLFSTFFAAMIGTRILTALRYAGMFGAALAVFTRGGYRSTEVAGLAVLTVLVFISTRTNAPALIDLIVFVYCGKSIGFKKIAQESLWIMSLILAAVVLSAEFGLIRNYVSSSWDNGVIRRREYLGFLYPLQPAQLLFNITLLVIYLKGEHFSISQAVALLIANLYVYFKADTRLSAWISIVAVIVALLLSVRLGKKVFGRILVVSAPFLFIICFFICWFATVNYSSSNPLLYELNSILGSRLKLGNDALNLYGTTLFGQSIEFVGNGLSVSGKLNYSGAYNYVDCLYVRLPLLYGWLFTVLFLAGMTFASIWASLKRDYRLALIFVAIAMHCVVDDLVIRLQFCTFLFLIADSLVEMANGHLARKRKEKSREPDLSLKVAWDDDNGNSDDADRSAPDALTAN